MTSHMMTTMVSCWMTARAESWQVGGRGTQLQYRTWSTPVRMKACLCFIRHCSPVLCGTDFYGGYIADLRAQHRAFSSALHACKISLAAEVFPGLHLCSQACRIFKMMYLKVACNLQRLWETSAFSFTTAMVRVSSQPPLKCYSKAL